MRLSAKIIIAGLWLLSGFVQLFLIAGGTAAHARAPDFLACGAAISPGAGSCEISADPHHQDTLPESFLSPGSLMLAKGGHGGGRPAPRPTPKPSQKSKSGSSGKWYYSSPSSSEKPGKSERYSTWGSPEKPFDECKWCEDCSDPECEDCEDCED